MVDAEVAILTPEEIRQLPDTDSSTSLLMREEVAQLADIRNELTGITLALVAVFLFECGLLSVALEMFHAMPR